MNMFLKGKFKISQIQHADHDGLDIVALEDLNIYSNVNGIVDYAGWEDKFNQKKGFGLYVRIKEENSNNYFYFGHLAKINVKIGDKVGKGFILGVQGNTGYSTGRHTHFCIREDKSKSKIKSAYNYLEIPNKLGIYENNFIVNFSENTILEIAKKTIRGDFGNGNERIRKIEALGYDFEIIQNKVNELEDKKYNLYNITQKVIRGEYGNMPNRKKKLEAEGYNYFEVQKEVNQILGV